MAIREGRWDCQYCGTKGILGRYTSCPTCAHSRPEGTKFYLPAEESAVDSASLEEQAKEGPDWICEYCRSSNPADETVCRHCGAAREGTSPEQQVKGYGVGEAPRSGDMDLDAPVERSTAPAVPRKPPTRRWLFVAGAVGLLILVAALALFRSSDLDVTVAELLWERSTTVEAYQTVVEEDWNVPAGGRVIRQREEVRRYDQVVVGYETQERQVSEQVQVGERTYVCGERDLGNGFFEDIECSEPIYETQYRTETVEEPVYQAVPVYDTTFTYEIDKWTVDRTERAAGNDHDPYWPPLSLASNEREGERTATYTVIFADGEGERYEMTFDEEEWRQYERNSRYQLKVNALGRPVEVVR